MKKLQLIKENVTAPFDLFLEKKTKEFLNEGKYSFVGNGVIFSILNGRVCIVPKATSFVDVAW